MSQFPSDDVLDAQLRQVPLPVGLSKRLREIAEWPDLDLERTLTEVPVPSTLAARLKQIPGNAQLDAAIVTVEVPADLASSLYPIAQSLQPVARKFKNSGWEQLLVPSLASLLLVTITLIYGTFAWQTLSHARPMQSPAPALAFLQPNPDRLEVVPEPEVASVENRVPATVITAESPYTKPEKMVALDFPELRLPELPAEPIPATNQQNEQQTLEKVVQKFREHAFGARMLSAQDVLELNSIRVPSVRGVLTPLVPGYDRGFLLRTNIHPPVKVAQHAALQQCLAPISLETESFDRTQFALERGTKVKTEEVRVEDFLATLESGLGDVKQSSPVVTLAGGPSPFGPAGSQWLGLNLRTGKTANRSRESTHLVVAVELSPRMIRAGTWDWLRTGLIEFVGRMEPNDRLSVVLVQREVLFRSEPLDRESRNWLQQVLPHKAPFNEPDTALALQTALETALISDLPSKSRQIVLITEGRTIPTSGFAAQLRELGAGLRAADLGITLVDVNSESSLTPATVVTGQSLRGEVRKANSRRNFLHLLQRELQGDAAVTAAETRLVVRFQPDAVASYRLLGHEANSMAQLVSPSVQIDLHPGDETHILFELLTHPDKPTEQATNEKSSATKTAVKPNQLIAECELSWLEPDTGKRKSKIYKFARNQWAGSWNEEPFWLRQAALASETAEWLRGSRLALRDLGWNSEIPSPSRLESLARDLQATSGKSHSLPQLISFMKHIPAARK